MTNKKSNMIINTAQGLIWACLFILPSAVWYFIASDIQSFGATFYLTTQLLLPAFLRRIFSSPAPTATPHRASTPVKLWNSAARWKPMWISYATG